MIEDKIRWVEDVHKKLIQTIAGKKVLDIGALGHRVECLNDDCFIWKKFDVCDYYCIDINKDQIAAANNTYLKGQVSYGDAEDFDLGTKFDVIIATELIEHISNIKGFLECCEKHLKKEGALIITTPNGSALNRIGGRLHTAFGNDYVNPQHKMWFCPITLKNLLQDYFDDISILTYDALWFNKLTGWFLPKLGRSQIFCVVRNKKNDT